MDRFQIGHPQMLWLVAAAAAAVLLWAALERRGRKRLEKLIAPEAWDRVVLGAARGRIRLAAAAAVLVLGALALAEPRYGFEYREIKRRGLDIVAVLDVSRSMLADDVKPSRMERAKMEIKGLLDLLRGDRAGLVLFAGSAFCECPLTGDYATFKMFLDEAGPESIPLGGTNLGAAIRTAVRAFPSGGAGDRVVLLFTDGEDHSGGVEAAVEEARRNKVAVFPVMMGTPEGTVLKAADKSGETAYVKDREGKVVFTRADAKQLEAIAQKTGGRTATCAGGTTPLEKVFESDIARLTRTELESRRQKIYEGRFQWPLGLMLIVLAADAFWTGRRRNGRA